MFVLSLLEAPNTMTNPLCVQTHLAIKLFLILMSLNFYKEYLFVFETLVFATSGIISTHEQIVTLQRERKTWNRIRPL